jgi:hypothetical protein
MNRNDVTLPRIPEPMPFIPKQPRLFLLERFLDVLLFLMVALLFAELIR